MIASKSNAENAASKQNFFIDFTNYVKLKRLIEYDPDSYDMILELMEKNANKFRNKDPKKYKLIMRCFLKNRYF